MGPNYSHVNQVQRDPQFQDKVVSESQTLQTYQTLTSSVCTETLNPQDVCCPAVFRVHSVRSRGPPQKKGVSPALYQSRINHVKGVCCVNPCRFVPSVPSVPNAVPEQAVGGRLQRFWQVWQNMGANPRVVSILKEGYTLPFKQRPLLVRFPLGSKWLRQSYKKSVVKRGSPKSQKEVGSRKGGCQVVPGVLQPSFPSSETKQEMEANLGFESVKCIPKHRHLQNGNPGDDPVVLDNRRVGHIAGLQRRILPHPDCPKVKKVSQVLPVQSNLSVHSSSLRVGHSSPGVYQGGQRSETHGSSEGYQNPPVPRRLVTASPFPGNLPTTYPDPLGPMSAVRLGGKYDQISWFPNRSSILWVTGST